MQSSNGSGTQRIMALFDAFARMHVDEILQYFSVDAIYHKIPMAEFKGHAQIAGTLEEFFVAGLSVGFEVGNIAECGNKVYVERVTRVRKDGNERAIPIMAIFELNENGSIVAWRDYFDKGQAGLA